MADAGAIKAGEAYIELGMDTRMVDRGLATTRQKMQAFGRDMRRLGIGLTAAGAAMLAPLGLALRKFSDYGDTVAKMARRTGMTTEAVSELAYVAEISGGDIGGLEKAIRRMARTISDAGDGLTTYIRALNRLGLQVEEFEGLTPEEAFLKIGRAIEATEDPMIRAAAAQEIFGRSGTALIPMFEQGAGALDELRQRAQDLGLVLDKETAESAEELTDSMTSLRGAVTGVGVAIGAALGPTVTRLVESMANAITKVSEWSRENPQLSKTVLILMGAVGGLAVGLGTLAIAIWGVTAALAVLSAHPIILALMAVAALGAALAGVHFALADAQMSTEDLGDAQEEAAEKAREMQGEIEDQIGALEDLMNAAQNAGGAIEDMQEPKYERLPEQVFELGPRRAFMEARHQVEGWRNILQDFYGQLADWQDEFERTGGADVERKMQKIRLEALEVTKQIIDWNKKLQEATRWADELGISLEWPAPAEELARGGRMGGIFGRLGGLPQGALEVTATGMVMDPMVREQQNTQKVIEKEGRKTRRAISEAGGLG